MKLSSRYLGVLFLPLFFIASCDGGGSTTETPLEDDNASVDPVVVDPTVDPVVDPQVGADRCDAAETKLIISIIEPVAWHPTGTGATNVKNRLNEALNGTHCLEIIESSITNDEQDLAKLGTGEIDFMVRAFSSSEDQSETFKLFDLPFMFRTYDDLIEFQSGDGGAFVKSSALASNLQGLAFWNGEFRQLFTNNTRPVLQPSDLQGFKIRHAPSEIARELYVLLGADPSPVAYFEVYEAVKTGVIDGAEYSWTSADSFLESNLDWGSLTEANMRVDGFMVFSSSERWAEFDPTVRTTIETIFSEETTLLNEVSKQEAITAKANITSRGISVRTLSETDHAAWVEAVQPLWNTYEPIVGADLINQAQSVQ